MTTADRPTINKEAGPRREPRPRIETERNPLRFSLFDFEPRDWERKRIHRYSVRSPRWFSLWVGLREFGAKLGIR